MGRVLSLHAGPERLAKTARAQLELDPGGVRGDRHYGRDPERAVLVVDDESYRELAARGMELPHGSLGENIVLGPDASADAGLRPGARLLVGGVVLEVAEACGVCAGLSRVHPSLPKLARGRRGYYARVVVGGLITLGDEVVWFREAQVA